MLFTEETLITHTNVNNKYFESNVSRVPNLPVKIRSRFTGLHTFKTLQLSPTEKYNRNLEVVF